MALTFVRQEGYTDATSLSDKEVFLEQTLASRDDSAAKLQPSHVMFDKRTASA